MSTYDCWHAFKKNLDIAPSGLQIEHFLQLAMDRTRNMNYHSCVKTAFDDSIWNWSYKLEGLKTCERLGSSEIVAKSFSGLCELKDWTVVQTAERAIWQPNDVILIICQPWKFGSLQTCFISFLVGIRGAWTANEIFSTVLYRMYRNPVNITRIKSFKCLMDGKIELHSISNTYTPFNWFHFNWKRTLAGQTRNRFKQSKLMRLALEEEEMFLWLFYSYIGQTRFVLRVIILKDLLWLTKGQKKGWTICSIFPCNWNLINETIQ